MGCPALSWKVTPGDRGTKGSEDPPPPREPPPSGAITTHHAKQILSYEPITSHNSPRTVTRGGPTRTGSDPTPLAPPTGRWGETTLAIRVRFAIAIASDLSIGEIRRDFLRREQCHLVSFNRRRQSQFLMFANRNMQSQPIFLGSPPNTRAIVWECGVNRNRNLRELCNFGALGLSSTMV